MIKNLFAFFALLFALSFTFAQTPIFFTLKNERNVTHPTLGSATAIDVFMHAGAAGTFHSRGQLYLRYNEFRFGQQVKANGNIIFEHGPLLAGDFVFFGQTTPKYNTINVIDNSRNVVALTWQNNFLTVFPNAAVHNEVPDTATLLYTIYMGIQNGAVTSNFDLNRQLMADQQYQLTNQDANADGRPDEQPYSNGFLPVEFMDFTFDLVGKNQVQLNWTTSKEVNNDYFEVQKFYPGADFLPLGRVTGFGTTDEQQYYHFLDDSRMEESNFYRIKQIDFDGKYDYSPIIEVHISGETQFVLYPTVTHDKCRIKAKGTADETYQVWVMDMVGRVVLKEKLEVIDTMGNMELDLNAVQQGMYIVRLVDRTGKSFTSRLIKI